MILDGDASYFFFFLMDPAPTEFSPLPLHAALPILARRLVISAAEDVGLAEPAALTVAVAAQQAAHFVGMPEARLPLSEAAVFLARAPKSNSAIDRKSTRLNSSHSQISYAVFCLKKK